MDPHAPTWEHCLEPAALSDIGLRRGNNQDSVAMVIASSRERFQSRGHLFLVADGMGAHAAGELASKVAADVVPLTYYKLVDRSPALALLTAIEDANSQILNRGMASDDFRGMGTTVSTLVLLPEGALVAHVGDSRVYRLRGSRIEQLTFDHSLVWELRAAGHVSSGEAPNYIPKNIITRSLGPNPQVQVDLEGIFPIEPWDTYLLCSDGLSGQVTDDEIGKVLAALPPKEAVRALVDLANLRGGPDNVTVVVVRVTGPLAPRGETGSSPHSPASPARSRIHPATVWALGLLALAIGVLTAIGQTDAAWVCSLAAAVAGGVALMQKFGRAGGQLASQPFGRGPYTSSDSTADAPFAERLAQVVQQLRDAATGADWTIDWDRFRAHESRAMAAGQSGDYVEAVRESCQAMMFMMAELRSQPDRRKDMGGEEDSFSC